MHLIADATDIKDDVILAVAVHDALELADHAAASRLSRVAPRCAGPMMRVTDGDSEGISGILAFGIGLWQQHTDHHADLRLFSVTGADDGLFHDVGGVFGNGDSGLRRHEHGDAARLPELQGRRRIRVDESRLHRRLVRTIALDDRDQPIMDHQQAGAEFGALARFKRTAGDVNQPISVALYETPAGAAEPRIDAEYANRM